MAFLLFAVNANGACWIGSTHVTGIVVVHLKTRVPTEFIGPVRLAVGIRPAGPPRLRRLVALEGRRLAYQHHEQRENMGEAAGEPHRGCDRATLQGLRLVAGPRYSDSGTAFPR